jgi:acyl carrier protein
MFASLRRWYSELVTRDERRLDQIFAGRLTLSDEEFYARHFSNSEIAKEVAIGVRRAFIKHVPLDMRKLEPGDNFGRELQFVWSHDSLADVELICDVEQTFGVSISEAEGRETLTMGALIALVDRKVKARNA